MKGLFLDQIEIETENLFEHVKKYYELTKKPVENEGLQTESTAPLNPLEKAKLRIEYVSCFLDDYTKRIL